MSALEDREAGAKPAAARSLWRRLGATARNAGTLPRRLWLSLPKRLYARALIIMVTPLIVMQTVVFGLFIARHWQTVTERLSEATARDVAAVVELVETAKTDEARRAALDLARSKLGLDARLLPGADLPEPRAGSLFSILDPILSKNLSFWVKRPFWLNTFGEDRGIEIRLQLDGAVLQVIAPRSQAYAVRAYQVVIWMVGTFAILLAIAVPFLRNQVKPITKLAEAAESFGKGRPIPADFRPRGAEEVRRAGMAFLLMRERIERQMEQRTAMLTGVSHDLRTILTRFRLQLALGPKHLDVKALNRDIDDMQAMLQGYLDFAKGEAEERDGDFDLASWFEDLAARAELLGRGLETSLEGSPLLRVRPNAFGRMLDNIVGNAFRYARRVRIHAVHGDKTLTVTVDDDGPGIARESREFVFRPFARLDFARNLDASGTGLGLAIARDVARSHGGDILLADSPMGGLRAIVEVPA